mmetsp:Transcript_16161/g.38323  ORF Transcript_16161/g.38323 Transcript_16161/m.38323 type:complete len:309 (-) Transcript_16161:101-1027(-)
MSAPQASHGTGITSFSAHLGQDTPEARISRGIAPVKPEFLAKSEIKIQVEAVCGVQDKRTSVAAVEKKSRNQLKRERKQERESDRNLCWSFVQGKCSFADACKRSHNLEAYLSNKEAELPGRCPFEATGECKYGLMCRWMSKHQNGTRQNDDGSAQLQIKQANTHTSSNRDVDNTAESAGDGTLPCGTVELPVSHQVDAEFNTLHSDLLVQLRKETYPFTRSTAMLNKLGCRISRKKKSCNKEVHALPLSFTPTASLVSSFCFRSADILFECSGTNCLLLQSPVDTAAGYAVCGDIGEHMGSDIRRGS